MARIIILYIVTAVLAVIGSSEVLNSEMNKVTALIHYSGLLGVCIYAFLRYPWWHLIIILAINIIIGFISYKVFERKMGAN